MGISLLIITLLIVFTYWRLPHTFFQQDEWLTFISNIYFSGRGTQGIVQSLFPVDALSHFNPLSRLFSWVEHFAFSMNFALFAWKSIVFHIVNAWLLYYFTLSWFKKKTIAFVSAVFFGVNSIPFQAVTWIAAANSYEVPAAFILLSLIFFHRFITRNKYQRINIFLSFAMLFISLLFHEEGIFLFLFYPVVFFMQDTVRRKKIVPLFFVYLILFMLLYGLLRVPLFFGFKQALPELTDISRPSLTVYPYRFGSIVLKSFSGSILPEKTLIRISEGFVRLAYPQFLTSDGIPNPFIAQSIVFDYISYVLSIAIVCALLVVVRKVKEKEIKKGLIWTILFIPLSFIPYAFVLGKAGYASILEPKFFYIGSIGISMLIAMLIHIAIHTFSRHTLLKRGVYVLFGLFIVTHIYSVRTYVKDLAAISFHRKTFLTKIIGAYPKLSKKIVFLTLSDMAYYGMPEKEKILPVQVGFGKMLMIWYQSDEKFPGCLYEEQYLLGMLEQGYKECGGRGFGYFRDYDKLAEAVRENNLLAESVIAYSWTDKTKQFTEITDQIRQKLKEDIE